MRRTRIIAVLLILLLMLPQGMAGSWVNAANTNNQRYYYNQLDSVSKGIYDAMYKMYEQGIFKTGNQEYDLIENGHLTSGQLAAYEGKQEELLKLFGAARDAFYADYPDIFYVDFSSLSITVSTSDASDEEEAENQTAVYKASLGAGKKDTYFVEGFSEKQQVEDAVKAHEAKINEIAAGAKKSESVREQVAYVYNAIIENTEYRLDTNCSPGNAGHVRTSYGALVKGQSLCEGYARAVKTVLDAMGIKSVLVQGNYRAPDGSDNLHMWNYVQIDGKWYGLDATAGDGMKGTVESDKYLLADKTVMDANYKPDGIMSDSGFRFTYPQLADADGDSEDSEQTPDEGSTDSSGYKTLFDKEGLVVQYRDGTASEGDVGVFKASYKGMGYQDAVDSEGVYILTRFYQYLPGLGDYKIGNWGYSDPKPFTMPQLKDALVIANGNSRYIEFAITKKAPAGPLYGEDLSTDSLEKNWNFQGTEADFIVSTGKLDNPKGAFIPAPFANNITPSNTGFLTCGRKYHVTVVFDEQLVPIDGESAGIKVAVEDGWSAEKYSKIENFKWDKNRTVEFDFTPSDQLADNYANYSFQITGLQGKGSLKPPTSFTYSAKKKISICAYRSQGIYLNLGAKPQLLEPDDIFCGDWVNEYGEKLKNVKNIVLTASKPELVVKTPTADQTKEMLGMVNGTIPEGYTVEKSATYELTLTTCNQNIIQTGQSVRLHIGFPEGYGPENAGVSYKAYHFLKDKSGKITGVEELDCIVTNKGLMVTCYSFSPFAVVALKEKEGAVTDVDTAIAQKLLVMNSEGGDVEIQEDKNARMCKMSEKGQKRTIVIKAKDGYVISGLYLNGESRSVSDKKSMKLTIKYEDLSGEGNILDVVFAQDKPKQETASSTQEKPSTGSQQSSVSSQNESSGGQSGSSGNASASASASNNTESSAKGNSNTDNLPFVVLPQTPGGVTVTDQASAAPSASAATPATPPTTSSANPVVSSPPSASSANIIGDILTDGSAGVISSEQGNDTAGVIVPDAEQEMEHIVLSTGENAMEFVVLPAEDDDSAIEKSEVGRILLIALSCVAGVGMVAVGAVGFVQMRRDRYDSE
ncbi:MAG: hypothetical protein K2N95_12560 [Lachnospiraceae bacterium]|nr:hypothetical protein [Lachnospiraceae bacterium]